MSDALSLNKIGYVILYAKDVEKTAVFYRDVLGIPVRDLNSEWTELGTEGTTLALHRHDEKVPGGGAQADVVFNVDDVKAAHAALAEKDVAMTALKQVWAHGGVVGLASEFHDPDGNRLSIHGTVAEGDWTGA